MKIMNKMYHSKAPIMLHNMYLTQHRVMDHLVPNQNSFQEEGLTHLDLDIMDTFALLYLLMLGRKTMTMWR